MQVRFVQVEAIKRQLDANHIVLLSNLAYSAAGEVLNCDIYSVATRAAVDLQVSPGAVLPDWERELQEPKQGHKEPAQGLCALLPLQACTAGVLSLHKHRCLPSGLDGFTCLHMQLPQL